MQCPMGCPMGYGTGMTAWGVVLVLGAFLAFAAVAVGIVLLAKSALSTSKPGDLGTSATMQPTPTAREILDERFARGEIDEEEYRRRRATLESSAT